MPKSAEAVGSAQDNTLRFSRRELAKALTVVEDGDPTEVEALLNGLPASPEPSWTVGITGPPGVGKSTLTDSLAREIRQRGFTVAVLAVDPSSPYTGGALLGDRIRMRSGIVDPGLFIRSMASRGHLGGLSLATSHARRVLESAGFDWILLETVGVGQSEIEVAHLADTTVLTLAPGAGDAIQAAKAGVMETADLFVVNKSDLEGARRVESDLRGALALGSATSTGWRPTITRVSASQNEGIAEFLDALLTFRSYLHDEDRLAKRRIRQAHYLVKATATQIVRYEVDAWTASHPGDFGELVTTVAENSLTPHAAARQLLRTIDRHSSGFGSE